MLFPLGDDNTGRFTTPYVTYTLIAINVMVFLYQLTSDSFTYGYSVVPYEITNGVDLIGPAGYNRRGEMIAPPQTPGPGLIYFTFISAMFMHGGFMHIAGNMLYLWIFGDNVEDRMGHTKYIVFYLLCGIIASATHIFFGPESKIPSLGASGAIAGVLGAYLVLYPHQHIRVLIPLGVFSQITELPALIVIGFWAVLQFFGGLGTIVETGGVAYMAHVGGFVAGLILVFFFRNRSSPPRQTFHQDDY